MTLKISELSQYQLDCKRYQQSIDKLPEGQEKTKLQSLLRDYKNIVHRIDTNLERIVYEDITRSLATNRQDSQRMNELRQQLEAAV
jgi:hypothetical protein